MAKIVRYSVIVLPILFFWAGTKMHKAKYANDPDYIYLVNATAICDGKSVGHIDNPGTTVMQLGALTIAIKHLFSNPENKPLVEHVFEEPDQFVSAIRFLFLIMNSLVLFFLGWFAIKKTGSVWLGIFLQLSTFITANTLDHVWTKMSPEPLLFFISCLYVIAILFYYAESEKNSWKYVMIFALVAGAGLGTKATFLPLVIFPVIALPTIKKKLVYAFGIIPSFVLFTIPAIPEYENMYWWFRGLIGHTGKYGHGKTGLIDTATYFPNLLQITQNNPIFATVVFLALVLVVFYFIRSIKTNNKINDNLRFLSGLVATSGFGILLVAKHYHHNHYLIPVLLLTGITFYFLLKTILKPAVNRSASLFILPAAVVFMALFVAWQQPSKLKYASKGYLLTNQEMDKTNTLLREKYADYARIYFYPFSFYRESALNFGDVYTKRKMLPYLKKLYPNTYFYDLYRDKIKYWNADVTLDEIVEFSSTQILLLGNRKGIDVLSVFAKKGIQLKKVYEGRVQSIFKVESFPSELSNTYQESIDEVSCDMEELTSDFQNFVGSNNEHFGKSWSRSNEFARSGLYSVKMDNKTEYAIEYLLKNVKAGEKYRVDVWRKSDNYSGRLVVCTEDPGIFYRAQNDYISSEKGWDLIRLEFTVSEKMQDQKIKIYFWNKDKKLCFFDDLTIRKLF